MGEMIKMVVFLTVLSVISGGSLKGLEEWAKPQIENNVMNKVKGPAIRAMLRGAENDPIKDRFKIVDGDEEHNVFVGVFGGKANTVVLESTSNGYGGPMGFVVAINMDEEKISAISVTTHTETGGLGSEAKDDPSFAAQFAGKALSETIKVTNDGGDISALSGATITSRTMCDGAMKAIAKYSKLKPQLSDKIKEVRK